MTMTTARTGLVGLMTLAALAVGCAGTVEDEGAPLVPDGPTATTQQPLSTFQNFSWGCANPLGCSADLALTTTAWTCFLSGVTGDLQGHQEVDGPTTLSEAEVLPIPGLNGNPGHWRLRVRSPLSHPIGLYATCIPNTTNRVYATWTSGSGATSIPGTPARKCFLRGVKNLWGFAANNQTVRTYRNLIGGWSLGGGNLTVSDKTTATAVCVDVPDEVIVDSRTVADGVTQTFPLAANDTANDTACGLSKVGGKFLTSSYNDGVWTSYDSPTKIWTWTLVNGKTAEARCVR